MRATRFPSLGLRDPAFLSQSAGPASWGIIGDAAPALLNANTFAWYKASAYQSIAAGAVIGNLTLPLADRLNPVLSNLVPLDVAAVLGATATFEDYLVNLLYWSDDVTRLPWNYSNAIASNPETLVFSAAGYCRQYCYITQEPAGQFTISAKIKITAGAPTLTFRTSGSVSGNAQALGGVPNATYQDFSATFQGSAASYVDVGINSDGAGTVGVKELQVRRTDDYPEYVQTTSTPIERAYNRVKTYSAWSQLSVYDGTSYAGWIPGANWTVGVPTLATFYMGLRVPTSVHGGYTYHTPGSFNPIIGIESGGLGRMRMYRGAWQYGANVPLSTWAVLTYQFDAGAGQSMMRINKAAAIPATTNTQSGIKMPFGFAGGQYMRASQHEFIARNVKDNTATQDAIIEYIASWLGIVV